MRVLLQEDDTGVFSGYIFTYETSKTGIMNITAYDQLRYFKNKDSYVYTGTASNFLRMLAKDFRIELGYVVDTRLSMSRVEQDTELFDMVNNALDETTLVDGITYVLYDDYGKVCLKRADQLFTNLTLTERRFRILSVLNSQLPYSYRNIEKQIRSLCGENNYTMSLDKENYKIIVRVALTAKKNVQAVSEMFDDTLPCNLIMEVSLLYNTYEMLQGKTYGELGRYTYQQLREEEL